MTEFFYAGIGSRETPKPVILEMQSVAMQLALRGWTLRSGRGKPPMKPKPETGSADLAFEDGARMVGGKTFIRTATLWAPAVEHAKQFHPTWDTLTEHAQALHARNSLVMLGDTLAQPVSFVVCWTLGGLVMGGTGQALRIAHSMGIKVFNLGNGDTQQDIWSWLDAPVR